MKSIVTFPHRLLWSQIKEMYPNEWVELSDVDWPATSSFPKRAVVAFHADNREQVVLNSLKSKNKKSNTVILFVGASTSSFTLDFAEIAA